VQKEGSSEDLILKSTFMKNKDANLNNKMTVLFIFNEDIYLILLVLRKADRNIERLTIHSETDGLLC
jgi:hypothetical protein